MAGTAASKDFTRGRSKGEFTGLLKNSDYPSTRLRANGIRFAGIYFVVGMKCRRAGSHRRSFFSAMASIWRILSRVMPNTLPVSSSV